MMSPTSGPVQHAGIWEAKISPVHFCKQLLVKWPAQIKGTDQSWHVQLRELFCLHKNTPLLALPHAAWSLHGIWQNSTQSGISGCCDRSLLPTCPKCWEAAVGARRGHGAFSSTKFWRFSQHTQKSFWQSSKQSLVNRISTFIQV